MAVDAADLLARARRVTPGGVHSPVRALRAAGGEPLFVAAAEGAELIATDGRRYLDFCMAFGPLPLGHANAAVARAIKAAVDAGWSYGTAETGSLALAEHLVALVPWVEQVRFMNSGTEAVMTALRLARAATGRDAVLKFDGCYHGHSDAMLIRAGSGLAGTPEASSAGVPRGVANDTLVAALDDETGLARLFAEHGHRLAAAVIEPLPANHGLLPQRPAFLAALAALCREHGVLLICDEVITGFRLAPGGYCELAGLVPDLVTWGKVIGGGLPVGAVAGRRELMELLAPAGPVYQAGTLSANPVAMAAGLATLQALGDLQVRARLERLGQHLEQAVAGVPALRLQRQGSVFWLALGADPATPLRRPAAIPAAATAAYPDLFRRALAAGIYLPPSPHEVGFLSAAHTPAHLDRLAECLRGAAHGLA